MKVVIDRFEGEYAVCQDYEGESVNIKRNILPNDSREGDVLSICGDNITIDYEESKIRRKKIKELSDKLWE